MGKTGPTRRPPEILRSLVIETNESITLVDPGLGLFDWLAPRRRLGLTAAWRLARQKASAHLLRPRLEQRGIAADRVRHIVLSQADPQLAGAIGDFPNASIHALPATVDRLSDDQHRPRPQVAHLPEFVIPARTAATDWQTFRSHRVEIEGLDLHLLDLPGPSDGHAGVLLHQANGLVLYPAAALTSPRDLTEPGATLGAQHWCNLLQHERPFESLMTRERLRRLTRRPPAPLTVIFARDATPTVSFGEGPHPNIGYF